MGRRGQGVAADGHGAGRLLQRLVEALAKRGQVALLLEPSRPPELSPAPLAHDWLRAKTLPGSLLDASVQSFGVYRSGALESYRAMPAASFRVVGATGALEQSMRRILYNDPSGLAESGEAIAAEGEGA